MNLGLLQALLEAIISMKFTRADFFNPTCLSVLTILSASGGSNERLMDSVKDKVSACPFHMCLSCTPHKYCFINANLLSSPFHHVTRFTLRTPHWRPLSHARDLSCQLQSTQLTLCPLVQVVLTAEKYRGWKIYMCTSRGWKKDIRKRKITSCHFKNYSIAFFISVGVQRVNNFNPIALLLRVPLGNKKKHCLHKN